MPNVFIKTKQTDNKLAEEADVIVLLTSVLNKQGIPKGSLGVLTRADTGGARPLYANFKVGETRKEAPISLTDFRVLSENERRDRLLLFQYFSKKSPAL